MAIGIGSIMPSALKLSPPPKFFTAQRWNAKIHCLRVSSKRPLVVKDLAWVGTSRNQSFASKRETSMKRAWTCLDPFSASRPLFCLFLPCRSRRGRVIALAGEVRTIIERRLKARRLDCLLIFHRNSKPVGDFRKSWASACRLVGVEGKLIYDLRRTAVRNMVRAGVDPAVAMKISGHRTRNVFDRYNIISEDDIRQAVLKTDAYVETLPTTSTLMPLRVQAVG